jgi:hypothetical protein
VLGGEQTHHLGAVVGSVRLKALQKKLVYDHLGDPWFVIHYQDALGPRRRWDIRHAMWQGVYGEAQERRASVRMRSRRANVVECPDMAKSTSGQVRFRGSLVHIFSPMLTRDRRSTHGAVTNDGLFAHIVEQL